MVVVVRLARAKISLTRDGQDTTHDESTGSRPLCTRNHSVFLGTGAATVCPNYTYSTRLARHASSSLSSPISNFCLALPFAVSFCSATLFTCPPIFFCILAISSSASIASASA